jgi:hypothetical protein
MSSDDKVKQPVFIVGCGRSGTTLLFDILAAHPALARTEGYPDGEDHEGWITHGRCVMAGIGNVHHPHYGDGINGYQYCLHMTRADVNENIVRAMHEHYWNGVLRQRPGLRVLNKQPHLSNKLDYVLGIFPDAKIVHIARDCEAMVASWIAVMEDHPTLSVYWPGDEKYPCLWLMPKPRDETALARLGRHKSFFPGGGSELFIDYWNRVNAGVVEQMAGRASQLFTLRYEDLVAQPAPTLDRLLKFCELPRHEFDLRHLLKNTAAKHSHRISPELRSAIATRTLEVRKLLGYERPSR